MPCDRIIVMRHAQKPRHKPHPRAGVREDGTPEPESLSVEGWQRAGALAAVFAGRPDHLAELGLARPDVVFASGHENRETKEGSSAVKTGSHSRRPVETVTPIVRRLGLTTVSAHLRGEEAAMVEDAKSRDGTVLICWQHEQIPAIGALIVGKPGIVPTQWADECYADLWVFSRAGQGFDFRSVSLPLIEPGEAL
jgi:hypothetical protein